MRSDRPVSARLCCSRLYGGPEVFHEHSDASPISRFRTADVQLPNPWVVVGLFIGACCHISSAAWR